MTTSPTGNSYRAFTLIEVLVGISILAVGTVGVLRAYSTSVSAIERAQYNIDAACLLRAVMGDIEEKAITDKGTSPGESMGELDSYPYIKIDTTRSADWRWTEEVTAADIEVSQQAVQATTKETEATGTETDAAAAAEETVEPYSLNLVKLTVMNRSRSPSNKVSVTTYMEAGNAAGE